MYWKYVLIFFVCMGLSASVSAEFYRYTDENGVIRFTDSYVDIPVKQRPHVQRFAEPDDRLSPEEIAERARLGKELEEKRPGAVPTAGPVVPTGALKQRKVELDRIKAQLVKEQKALENEGKTISKSDFKRRRAYNNRVIRFNQGLAEHEKELKAFNDTISALNQKAQALDEERAALEKTSVRLLKEKKELEMEKKLVSPTDLIRINAYRDKVTDFNKRVADFKKKQKAFNQKTKAFNRQTKK